MGGTNPFIPGEVFLFLKTVTTSHAQNERAKLLLSISLSNTYEPVRTQTAGHIDKAVASRIPTGVFFLRAYL